MRSWSADRPAHHRPLRAISAIVAVALAAAACSSTIGTDDAALAVTVPQGAGDKALPVVVTTDLGPGDVLALGFLLGHPDIDVVAVAVDGGVLVGCEVGVDHVLRLVAAAAASTLVSCANIPAASAGPAAPAALQQAAADLYGLQLPAADAVPDDRPPAEVIAAAVRSAPGEIRILTLGPLTHVAASLESGADVAEGIGHLYALGGSAGPDEAEEYITLDPAAAIAVLASDVPLTILPAAAAATPIVADALDVALNSAARPTGEFLSQLAVVLTNAPSPMPWGEPLAAAIVTDESVGTFEMVGVQISETGALTERAGGHTTRLLRQSQPDFLAAALSALSGATQPAAPEQELDAASATGRLVWQFTLNQGAQAGNKSRSVLDDGVLYLVGFDNRLYALESGTGEVVWDRDLEESGPGLVEVAASPDAIFVSDVTLANELVDPSSSIAAFDRVTGDELWRVRLDAEIDGIVRTPTYGEGLVVYGAENVGMIGADPDTGATLWTFPVAVSSAAGAATVADGVVYFGARDAMVYALDATSGTEIWRVPTRPSSIGVASSPALVDGVVYFGSDSGQVLAVEATSGEVVWEVDVGPVQGIPSSPAYGDGKVFFGTIGPPGSGLPGGLIALDASTGTEVWRAVRPGGFVISSPAYADGVIYALTGDTNVLTAVAAASGTELWHFELDGSGSDSPVVFGGIVYFQANGQVFAVARPE